VEPLAAILLGAAHIHQLPAPPHVLLHLGTECADLGIVALAYLDVAFRISGDARDELAAFFRPAQPAAVHDLEILDTEQPEHPEGIRRPPVVLVAVEDDRRVVVNALGAQQLLEALATHVVADQGVVEVGHPVDLHGARDVAGLVEQHVLVRLDETDLGIVEMIRYPLG